MKRYLLPILLSLTASAAVIATAQTPAEYLADWDTLTPEQRSILISPLKERWNDAPPEQRANMLRHARRWQNMTPEQRTEVRQGRHRFDEMSPEQRRRARAVYTHISALPPEQRARFHAQWRQMTPEQKDQWVKEHPAPEWPRR